MGRAFSTDGKKRNARRIWRENRKEREHLEELDIGGEEILSRVGGCA
jgi:hypothetical protein